MLLGHANTEIEVDLVGSGCIFVVATLESSVAPVPRALMRCDVKRSVHRAFCFAVPLVGLVPSACVLLAIEKTLPY